VLLESQKGGTGLDSLVHVQNSRGMLMGVRFSQAALLVDDNYSGSCTAHGIY
jgi:hypothetical protein